MSQDKPTETALSRRRLWLLLAAACAARAHAAAAAVDDVPGWGATRWGMTRDEIAHAVGPALVRLAAPLDYGALVARDTLPGQRLAGRPFVALFQLDRATERLAQVLLRYRGDFPMMNDFAALRDLLARDYGPPHERRAATDDSAGFPSFWIEAAWKFPSTEIVLSLVDPNADPFSGQRKTLLVRYTARGAKR